MAGTELQGHLDGMLLAVLEAGPLHGYAIVEELARQQQRELLEVRGDRTQSETSEAAAGASTASTALRNVRPLATRSRTACAPVCESA